MAVGKRIRVRPYHAGGPMAPQVWHDRSDCEQGRWIPSVALRPGTGDRAHCPECARLDAVRPVDGVDDERAGEAEPARPRVVEKRERARDPRRRPTLGSLLGAVATIGLLVLAGLWLRGGLEPDHGRNRVAATVASASPTTSTTRKVPAAFAAAIAAAAKKAPAPAAPIPTPAATVAPAPAEEPETDPAAKGSFSVGPDGYTHGVESDGEVCSDNPDDPQFPCSYRVPGSDGFGAPLPDDAPSAAVPNAAAPAGATAGATPSAGGGGQGPVAAVRAQRRAARQAARANRSR